MLRHRRTPQAKRLNRLNKIAGIELQTARSLQLCIVGRNQVVLLVVTLSNYWL